ncbi:MAG: hypothetical protein IT337_08700 [Thermomicrobiales bacterium]|nr:hypothetical protein [Thermomicrobiales bacterium]
MTGRIVSSARGFSRRTLIAAGLGAGLAAGFARAGISAQNASDLAAPTGAASWPKLNLNSAAAEALAAVPAAGERMTREFLEYRPYASIGQFRGELSKYISPEDTAAFESYLFVPVDPNQADTDTLQQLPGVNVDAAQQLIAGRPFADADTFVAALAGLASQELADAARTFLAPDAGEIATWLRYDLNTASETQLIATPGAGKRMTREFLEYRPYASVGQFRGEMGKYIDPEDVAALERYLFVPVDPNQADADTLLQLPGLTADGAQALIAARPFADAAAFLTALGQQAAPIWVEASKSYLAAAS